MHAVRAEELLDDEVDVLERLEVSEGSRGLIIPFSTVPES